MKLSALSLDLPSLWARDAVAIQDISNPVCCLSGLVGGEGHWSCPGKAMDLDQVARKVCECKVVSLLASICWLMKGIIFWRGLQFLVVKRLLPSILTT